MSDVSAPVSVSLSVGFDKGGSIISLLRPDAISVRSRVREDGIRDS